jgi:hypothetical protein
MERFFRSQILKLIDHLNADRIEDALDHMSFLTSSPA